MAVPQPFPEHHVQSFTRAFEIDPAKTAEQFTLGGDFVTQIRGFRKMLEIWAERVHLESRGIPTFRPDEPLPLPDWL